MALPVERRPSKAVRDRAQRIPDSCVELLKKNDFRYRELVGSERDAAILTVLKRVGSKNLTVAGDSGARARWEKGWGENLSQLESGGSGLASLTPKYIRPNPTLRLNQNYIKSFDPEFELNWYQVFRGGCFSAISPMST